MPTFRSTKQSDIPQQVDYYLAIGGNGSAH
jgi:hypothetical protein